jgi:hypothetical protein
MEIKKFKWSDKNSFYKSIGNRILSPFAIYFIKTIVSYNTLKKKIDGYINTYTQLF